MRRLAAASLALLMMVLVLGSSAMATPKSDKAQARVTKRLGKMNAEEAIAILKGKPAEKPAPKSEHQPPKFLKLQKR